MNNRNYIIFEVREIGLIDFNQILDDAPETLKYSIDGVRAIVKWRCECEIPSSIGLLTTKVGPFNHDDILNIISSKTWTKYEPMSGGTI